MSDRQEKDKLEWEERRVDLVERVRTLEEQVRL